jgi:hypothetical protein
MLFFSLPHLLTFLVEVFCFTAIFIMRAGELILRLEQFHIDLNLPFTIDTHVCAVRIKAGIKCAIYNTRSFKCGKI